LRVMDGIATDQPNPNGELPLPEPYDKASCRPEPERPGDV